MNSNRLVIEENQKQANKKVSMERFNSKLSCKIEFFVSYSIHIKNTCVNL